MATEQEPKYHPSVRKNHSFFWDTKLSPERMEEISEWIGALSPENRKKLNDLLDDVREDCNWDAASSLD